MVALAWPGPTALVLVLIVGSWAVAAGLLQIFAAFGAGEPAGTRALFILGGLATIAFGVVLFAHPGVGALTLALLFGLFNLIDGGLGAHPRHRAAPDRQVPALRRPGQEGKDRCGLSLPDGSQAQHHPAERCGRSGR